MHIPEMQGLLEILTASEELPQFDIHPGLLKLFQTYWTSKTRALHEHSDTAFGDITKKVNTFNEELGNYKNAQVLPEEATGEDSEAFEAKQQLLNLIPVMDYVNQNGNVISFHPKKGYTPSQRFDIAHSQQDVAGFLNWIVCKIGYNELGHNAGDYLEQPRHLRPDSASTAEFVRLFGMTTRHTRTCEVCGSVYVLFDGGNQCNIGITVVNPDHDQSGVEKPQNLRARLLEGWLTELHPNTECETCLTREITELSEGDILDKKSYTQDRPVEVRLVSSPEYLMFQVTQFDYRESSTGLTQVKITPNVRVPLWLDLDEFKHEDYDAESGELRYKLWATIYHAGSGSGGHYYGVYTGPQGLREIDDDLVKGASTRNLTRVPRPSEEAKEKGYVGEAPYMLIYRRFRKSGRSQHPEPAAAETTERGTKRASGFNSKEKSTPRTTRSGNKAGLKSKDGQAKADAAAKVDGDAVDELQGGASPRKKQKKSRS